MYDFVRLEASFFIFLRLKVILKRFYNQSILHAFGKIFIFYDGVLAFGYFIF